MTELHAQQECELHPAMRDRIKSIAAGVFQVAADDLELSMGPDDVDRWDSLNHLRLITEVESAFSLQLSMEQIQGIHSLADLARSVSAASA